MRNSPRRRARAATSLLAVLCAAIVIATVAPVAVAAADGDAGCRLIARALTVETHRVAPDAARAANHALVAVDATSGLPPRLGWQLATVPGAAGVVNQTQSAYQIQVMDAGTGKVVWDTAQLQSTQQLSIGYGGPPLPRDADAQWRVRVWDGDGNACPWSDDASAGGAPAVWSVGTLGDWRGAMWISNDNGPMPTNSCVFYADQPAPMLRREFELASGARGDSAAGATVVKARLHVSGLGYYTILLDGVKVGDSELDPGWTDPGKRVYYASYDVTDRLQASAAAGNRSHALGMVLGQAFWNPSPLQFWGHVNFRERLAGLGWRPQGIAVLTIYYSDGTTQDVVTNETWQASPGGPLKYNNVYLGERYDAREAAALDGWAAAGFNSSSWAAAKAANNGTAGALGPLEPQHAPPIRRTETLTPLSVVAVPAPLDVEQAAVRSSSAGHSVSGGAATAYIVDLGVNHAGIVTLSVPGTTAADAGTTIRLRYGELLYPNNTLNVMTSVAGQVKSPGEGGPCAPAIAWQQDLFTLSGGPSDSARTLRGVPARSTASDAEVYTTEFAWHGFRYAEITGWPAHLPAPTTANIVGHVLHSDVRRTGTFASSDATLAGVNAMAEHAHTSNMVGIQSDCPHRERLGYGGDAAATLETAMLRWDTSAFYEKRVSDYVDAQVAGGGATEVAPNVQLADGGLGGGSGPIGWDSFLLLAQIALYEEYGSDRVFVQHYNATAAWITFLENPPQPGMVYNGLSDWMSLEASPAQLTGAMFLFLNFDGWATINAVLGHDDVAATYRAKAAAAAADLNTRFLNASTGVYSAPQTADGAPAFNATQCAQSMPLYYNVTPPGAVTDAVRAVLVDNISSRQKGHLAAGMFGIKTALMALADMAADDLAVQLVTRPDYPSYAYMLGMNATTLWESWFFSDNVYSHNHAMFSSVAVWMTRALGGIRLPAGAVAYDHIEVRPSVPSQLAWVNATLDTPRGLIVSNWSAVQRGDASREFTLLVTVPPNAEATVVVPGKQGGGAAPHVVGSGTWTFRSTLPVTQA